MVDIKKIYSDCYGVGKFIIMKNEFLTVYMTTIAPYFNPRVSVITEIEIIFKDGCID